ncbi:uncharacterized protein LOC105433610 [Pogonomyrmex barbatus]|uniref:Uncharacterized protein LOC105433610 n=1 Tax=Pogonomyrmex barbatus TaxID=144034 RepID=A0A6I9WTC1_9HYME|nr:uncharacterized protein LOC105433610 [Pogonomyrmex barbatus]
MVGYCYVCKIGIKAKDYLSIHRLPKDKLVREKWFQFIGHKASTNSGICSGHFKQSDFIYKIYGGAVRRYLKPGAYPSIECDSQNTKQDVKINSNSENSNDWILQEDNDIYESKSDTENLIDIPLECFKQATVLDDPLAITNFDANFETNIPLGDETQECINIDKTKINTESLRHADIQLKSDKNRM